VAANAVNAACRDGAVGAAVGEMVAQAMPPKNGIAYSDAEKNTVMGYAKIISGGVAAYAGGNAQTAINSADTAVTNNAFVPIIMGLVWAIDKGFTAYQVAQDIAAIRDGTKTVAELATEKGTDYIANMIVGNVGKYGIKVVEKYVTINGKSVVTYTQEKLNKAPDVSENRMLSSQTSGEMLGAKGVPVPSKPFPFGTEGHRIDIENPKPGERPAQIQYETGSKKYFYQPLTNTLTTDPQGTKPADRSVQKLLDNPQAMKEINKALRYLGYK
jgi:hypothetical protein